MNVEEKFYSLFGDGITTTELTLGIALPIGAWDSVSFYLNLSGYLAATEFYIQPQFSDIAAVDWYKLGGADAAGLATVATTAMTMLPYPFRWIFNAVAQPIGFFPIIISIINPGAQYIRLRGRATTSDTDALDIRVLRGGNTKFNGIE